MALSYTAQAITTLAYHLPCVSRLVCDAALWQQTLMYSQLKCHVKWRGRVACLFHTCSASPRLPVLHALLYETPETSAGGLWVGDMFSQLHLLPPLRREVCDRSTGGIWHVHLGRACPVAEPGWWCWKQSWSPQKGSWCRFLGSPDAGGCSGDLLALQVDCRGPVVLTVMVLRWGETRCSKDFTAEVTKCTHQLTDSYRAGYLFINCPSVKTSVVTRCCSINSTTIVPLKQKNILLTTLTNYRLSWPMCLMC